MKYDENLKISGEYTAISISPSVKKDSKILAEIREAIKTGNKKILNILKETGIILDIKECHNLIPTTGRTVLARLLTGDTTYSGEIDWGALGSAATPAFTNASTKLGTEVYRMQATAQSYDQNVVYIDWFLSAGDVANQTFEEFGAFIDGTGSANTGQAWSLLKTGGWVKSGSMFISGKYTFV